MHQSVGLEDKDPQILHTRDIGLDIVQKTGDHIPCTRPYLRRLLAQGIYLYCPSRCCRLELPPGVSLRKAVALCVAPVRLSGAVAGSAMVVLLPS
jgi:hypothetical protein